MFLNSLYFILSISPPSRLINSANYRFKLTRNNCEHRIKYLLYVNGLKTYASTEKYLEHLVSIAETFFNYILIEFELNKCLTLKERCRLQCSKINNIGVEQAERINHEIVKGTIRKEYNETPKKAIKTSLSAKNITISTNQESIFALS